MASRAASLLSTATMALVALVVAHNLVFLAGFGAAFGQALAQTGHDQRWTSAVVTVLAGAVGCLAAAAWQLRHLSSVARRSGARSVGAPSGRSFVRRWLRLGLGLTAATAILFVLQENVEHLHLGEPLPGLSVLISGAYPNAVVILPVVAFAVALVGALFGWRFAILAARIRAARDRRSVRSKTRRHMAPEVDRRPSTLRGRGFAVRAPPLATAVR
jgi:hypothetical protein